MSNPKPDAISQAQAIAREQRERVQQRMLQASGLAQGTSQRIHDAIRACLDSLGFTYRPVIYHVEHASAHSFVLHQSTGFLVEFRIVVPYQGQPKISVLCRFNGQKQPLKLAFTADAHAFEANLSDLKQQVLFAAGLPQA
jgi:hypothetical protein